MLASMHFPMGTLFNAAAVIAGSAIGLALRRGLPEQFKTAVFQAIGLVTLVIGVQMVLQARNATSLLLLVFSLLIGALLGTALMLQDRLEAVSERLKRRSGNSESGFTEGLVSAFLIFCVGSLTILGCLQEGLTGDATLLYTKSVLDGFMSIALASTFGWGVMASVIPLLALQLGLTVLGGLFGASASPALRANVTAVGGTLILGIGLNLLQLTKLKLVNFLPALVIVVLLTLLLSLYAG
jgi:uncharacterized membrane protein YqgA involved in biofilm formation